MEKVWRFQCDPGNDSDPEITVFIGPVFNGRVLQETSDPVVVRLSELADTADLLDATALRAIVAARPAPAKSEQPEV